MTQRTPSLSNSYKNPTNAPLYYLQVQANLLRYHNFYESSHQQREQTTPEGGDHTPPVTQASQIENPSDEPTLQNVSPPQDPLPMQDP